MYEQIYNLTSMFFKSLKGNLMYEFLISKFNGKRGPKRQLSLEQIVALNIYRFHFKMGDLKNYHKMIKELMSDKVPNLPNYENFMKATNKSTVFILAFMNFLMEMNRKKESEIHYMDSTPITVCMNHKIYSYVFCQEQIRLILSPVLLFAYNKASSASFEFFASDEMNFLDS